MGMANCSVSSRGAREEGDGGGPQRKEEGGRQRGEDSGTEDKGRRKERRVRADDYELATDSGSPGSAAKTRARTGSAAKMRELERVQRCLRVRVGSSYVVCACV